MRMVRIALAAALLLPMPALAQTGITKTEVRSQSPETTAREMRDQLWAMFQPADMRSKAPPRAVLRDTFFSTPAYPSSVPGICRSDTAFVYFAPVDPGERHPDANTPVRAYGLDVSHQYHQVAPLESGWDQDNDWFRVRGRRACAALGKDAAFFNAETDDAAAEGVRLAGAVVAALAAGKVMPDCKNLRLPEGKTCAAMGEGLKADTLWSHGACELPVRAGQDCAQLDLGSLAMYVHFRRANANAPIEIVSVELFDEIVIADQRID